jgi:hypothetical protein
MKGFSRNNSQAVSLTTACDCGLTPEPKSAGGSFTIAAIVSGQDMQANALLSAAFYDLDLALGSERVPPIPRLSG